MNWEDRKMPKCPECDTSMVPRPPFYTCEVCGLSVKKTETGKLDDMWEQGRRAFDEENEGIKTKKKHKRYLDWYLSTKK